MNITAPKFDQAEMDSLNNCLASKWVTQGPLVKKFESSVAVYHQVQYALATTSCSTALHLATLSLGLGPGDEVIVPAFTWVTSAHCAEYVGARAVFADVNPDTYNLDPRALEVAITPRSKAVVIVHLFGLAAEMDEILTIAKRHSLYVIEDAACAIGTTYNGIPVGGMGDVGCFSFHPRKIITTGEGGMVTTNNPVLAEKIGYLRNHGSSDSPDIEAGPTKPYSMGRFDQLGFNFRLSDIQAAVGLAQMAKLKSLLAERDSLARRYTQKLIAIEDLVLPPPPGKCGHTYQSYVIRLKSGGIERRNRIMDLLAERKIQSRPGTHAVHRLGYYREKYRLKPEMFPNSCLGEDTTITLPIFPGMTEEDQNSVVDTLWNALKFSR